MMYIYDKMGELRYGEASAMGLVLFVVLVLLTIVYAQVTKRLQNAR